MDLSTSISDLNWLAVFTAAVSTFIIGGLWYSPLMFMKAWLEVGKIDRDEPKKRSDIMVFGFAFLFSFIIALNLAMFIGDGDAVFGATAGFLAGLGWVALAIGIIALFENRSVKYILINGGYMVVAFTVMGLILGAWK